MRTRRNPWAPCESPRDYTDLGVGKHGFEVRATGRAGSTDPTPAGYVWTVTEPPPVNCGPVITVSTNADSWIDRTNSRHNHGSDTTMHVRRQRSTDAFRTFVRFALEADTPEGCEVESATLRGYAREWTQNRT